MLNEKEEAFIRNWEQHREKEKGMLYQLLTGLPLGILFSLPIVLILLSSRFWFRRADMVANARLNVGVLIIAVILIAMFVAVMYRRHQWDMKEQQYAELTSRRDKS